MQTLYHREEHFRGGETIKDIVIGMSDGLTVPFALAAGISGAISLPFPDAVAGFLKIVSEGGQPNNPAVSLKPGELPFGELADGGSQLEAQVVEGAQLSAQIPRDIAVL